MVDRVARCVGFSILWAALAWAAQPISSAGEQREREGGYRTGSPPTRPFDGSDREMQALMARIYGVGGCARPGKPCKPAADLFALGGDRLAAYLIRQFERSVEEGYPSANTYLNYVAYTHSKTGFEYIRDRVERKAEFSIREQRSAVHALSMTGRVEAVGVAMRLLGRERDTGILTGAINTLWRSAIRFESVRDEVVRELVEIESGTRYRGKMRWAARASLMMLEKHFDTGTDFRPKGPGTRPGAPWGSGLRRSGPPSACSA